MTESQWLEWNDLSTLLAFLRDEHRVARTKQGRRRLRLFQCACLRRIWTSLPSDEHRHFIEVVERSADGLADEDEVKQAQWACPAIHINLGEPGSFFIHSIIFNSLVGRSVFQAALSTAGMLSTLSSLQSLFTNPNITNLFAYLGAINEGAATKPEEAVQCAILRDLFGNPFRPLRKRTFSADVRSLANAVVAGDASTLGILADALVDLGEDQAAAHCREAQHVRGCHVIDWILGQ
jgi:hypothetical protein